MPYEKREPTAYEKTVASILSQCPSYQRWAAFWAFGILFGFWGAVYSAFKDNWTELWLGGLTALMSVTMLTVVIRAHARNHMYIEVLSEWHYEEVVKRRHIHDD